MRGNLELRSTKYDLKDDSYRDGMRNTGCSILLTKRFYILNSIFCILLFSTIHAQKINVQAKFSGDSVKIGKPIEFYLSAHYPENLNLLFPDSTFSFAPFELQKKIYFPTLTKNGISKDSVIYMLATYEVDSIQMLKLPVFVVNKMDCTQVFSNTDSVYFQNLVKAVPDSLTAEKLPLKVNTNYLGVRWQLNYILLAIGGGILLITLILVWVFFGKRIRKYFKLKKMSKNYEAFRTKFENSVETLDKDFSPQRVETSLVIWKNYLETLLSKPYTKYTSKEIKTVEKSEELGHALTEIDRMIYGHERGNVHAPFADLKAYVRQQYEKKKEEIAHG
jgi:hypothetical protein